MNDQQLERALQSIGKGCFIKYFENFSNPNISKEDLIDILMKNEGYMESGCKTRISQSRRIIDSGKTNEALNIILKSERVPQEFTDKCKILLGK